MKKHRYRWMGILILILIGVQLAACSPENSSPPKIEPSQLEPIGDGEFKRVILTEKAAERLSIETAVIREDQVVRTHTYVGEVVILPADSAMVSGSNVSLTAGGDYWVRLELNEREWEQIWDDQPALIRPISADGESAGWEALPREMLLSEENGDVEDEDDQSEIDSKVKLFKINGEDHTFASGDRVLAEVAVSDRLTRKVIPYAALIYDVEGGNWVYVKDSGSLSFSRAKVVVDYIEGNTVYLIEGPAVGIEIVTVGGMELFGEETGVSK